MDDTSTGSVTGTSTLRQSSVQAGSVSGQQWQVTAEHPLGWRIPRKGKTPKEARENAEAAVRAIHFSTYCKGEWMTATASLNAPINVNGSMAAAGMGTRGAAMVNLGGIQITIQGNADRDAVRQGSRQGVLEALKAAGVM